MRVEDRSYFSMYRFVNTDFMVSKIADNVKPPEPVLKVLTLMSSVVPKAKLLPKVDLGALALRETEKRKLVCIPLHSLHRCIQMYYT